jgi:integrase
MLAKLPLTPKGIEALKPPPLGKRKLVYDALVPGLAVRVTDKGAKAFVLVARFPGSQNPTARSLGLVGRLTLEAARDRGRDWLALIAQGRDPAQQAKQAEANTVRAVCEDWFARKGSGHRSARQSRSRLERLVYPTLGSMPIGEVRRSDVVRLHDRLTAGNGAIIANRVVAMLGSIFSWYSVRNEEFRNPVIRGMTTAEQARERILTDDELRAVWWAAEGVFGALVRFLLLTAARRGEALEMRWAEIDGATWTLPAARNKTGVELVRPLSQAALAVLAAQLRKGDFVFSRSGSGALGGLTELKAKLDRDSGTAGWRLHDLRRSARSLMSRAGVSSDHAERCLGHVIGSIRGVYDRHSYRAEMLTAYEKLATLIAGIVDPQPNVVAMRGER